MQGSPTHLHVKQKLCYWSAALPKGYGALADGCVCWRILHKSNHVKPSQGTVCFARGLGTGFFPVPHMMMIFCCSREKLESFLPRHLCRRGHGFLGALWKRGARPPADEQGLLRAYQAVSEEEACEEETGLGKLYQAYLQKCHELPYYG